MPTFEPVELSNVSQHTVGVQQQCWLPKRLDCVPREDGSDGHGKNTHQKKTSGSATPLVLFLLKSMSDAKDEERSEEGSLSPSTVSYAQHKRSHSPSK